MRYLWSGGQGKCPQLFETPGWRGDGRFVKLKLMRANSLGVSERLTLHKKKPIEFLCNPGWFVFVNTLKRLPCYGVTITVLWHNRFLKSSGFLKAKNKILAHFYFYFWKTGVDPKRTLKIKRLLRIFALLKQLLERLSWEAARCEEVTKDINSNNKLEIFLSNFLEET